MPAPPKVMQVEPVEIDADDWEDVVAGAGREVIRFVDRSRVPLSRGMAKMSKDFLDRIADAIVEAFRAAFDLDDNDEMEADDGDGQIGGDE